MRAEIYSFNDNLAYVCECGSVKFNLLKSGNVECDNCQQKLIQLNWSEIMDTSIQAGLTDLQKLGTEFSEVTEQEIEKAKVTVIDAVKNNGGYAYWRTIKKFANNSDSDAALSKALNILLREKRLRQKEDEIEHDWEYSLVKQK